jgi:hypothetical protein
MLQGIIVRGTTPTHDFELPYPKELIKDVRVSYVQNKQEIITKTLEECRMVGNILSTDLTQEETFLFFPRWKVDIEIKIQLFDKKVVRSEEAIELRVVDTINKEVFD